MRWLHKAPFRDEFRRAILTAGSAGNQTVRPPGHKGYDSCACEVGEDVTVTGEAAESLPAQEVSARDSFAAFVLHRSDALLHTAYLLTQDRQLAEDLLQTALAKAWPRWSRIDASPQAYVRKILVNTYSSWWHRRWNGELSTGQPPVATSDEPDGDTTTDVRTALERLPKRQRAVIVLRFFEDLTEAETARIMQCTVGTVKSQTSKALAKLRVDPALVDDLSVDGRQVP